MHTNTERLLHFMKVIAWVVFIGLLIKAGALLFSYFMSIGRPGAADNLYMGFDLSALRAYDLGQYTFSLSLAVALILLEAYIAFLVVSLLNRIRLAHPFTEAVARLLERISHLLLGTWIVAVIYNGHTQWLAKRVAVEQEGALSTETIFFAAVLFIVAQVYKRGVELQRESELTV